MPYRMTVLYTVTTNPTNRGFANPHSGGWSESFWTNANQSGAIAFVNAIAQNRASTLPSQASAFGYRVQNFTIVGNKLLPGGAVTGKVQFAGNATYSTDVPQMALMVNFSTSGGINNTRPVLRCLPDSVVSGGEYQPDQGFNNLMAAYLNFISIANGVGWVGRDLSLGSVRVIAFNAGVLTVSAAIPGVGVGDFVRLNRVYSTLGFPVKGAYQVTAINGVNYTLGNPPNATVIAPSGTARKDALLFFDINNGVPNRAVVRKVGRPFEQYRGRRSKRR